MPERLPDPEFAERLQKEARKRGIKKNNQFAKALNKKASGTETWWKGSYPTYSSDFKKICDLLGVSSDYLLFGKETPPRIMNFRIIATEQEKELIEKTEGPFFLDNLVPIPIARDPIHAGRPHLVREDPDGFAVIYEKWARKRDNYIVFRVKGDSMEPTIEDQWLVGINFTRKEILKLNERIVAIKDEEDAVSIKRLKIIAGNHFLFMPDNPIRSKETFVYDGKSAEEKIIGKVEWWCGRQK